MTVDLVKAIAWPVTIIIASLVLLALAKGGRVRSLSASKEGGLKLDLAPIDTRGTIEYELRRRIDEIDEEIFAAAREEVRRLRKPIQRAIAGAGLCASALRAAASELRGILYGAVDENNLKGRLATAARGAYVDDKLSRMKEDYLDLATDGAECAAAAPAQYPAWPDIEDPLRQALEGWALRVASIVAEGCRAKIQTYEEYRPRFEAAGDKAYVAIVDECREKNARYIAELGA